MNPTDVYNEQLPPDNTTSDLYDRLTRNDRTREVDNVVFDLQRGPFNLTQSRDFEKTRARRLREGQDFVVNRQLGFISMRVPVQPDHIIGVAYQYSYNGEVYTVGDLPPNVADRFERDTSDHPFCANDDSLSTNTNVYFVKMLKSATQRVDVPLWDLMMKNVYNIGAYNVNPDDFQFGIFYDEPGIGEKQFLPCLLYTSPSPRDATLSRMPSSA